MPENPSQIDGLPRKSFGLDPARDGELQVPPSKSPAAGAAAAAISSAPNRRSAAESARREPVRLFGGGIASACKAELGESGPGRRAINCKRFAKFRK